MKGFWFFLLCLPFLGTAHADSLNDVIREASTAFGNHVADSMWTNRCSRPEALRMYANCYVNNEGVALWQMKGAEREKWKPTAVKESVRLQRVYREQMEIAREQGERRAQANQMNHQMCDFWRQQNPSERQLEKTEQYCGR